MKIDRKYISVIVALGLVAVIAAKFWSSSSDVPPTGISSTSGPAIILVRGDNSPSCRAIHGLVEQAAERYRGRIEVIQTDWTANNPLIERYRIRFLPTVVFINRNGAEVGRLVGESEAVQNQLARALSQAESLLKQ